MKEPAARPRRMSIADLIIKTSNSARTLPGDNGISNDSVGAGNGTFAAQIATPADLQELADGRSVVEVGDGEFLTRNVVDRIKQRRASLVPGDDSQPPPQERRPSLDMSSFGQGFGVGSPIMRP